MKIAGRKHKLGIEKDILPVADHTTVTAGNMNCIFWNDADITFRKFKSLLLDVECAMTA